MTPVSATQDEDLLIISEDVADTPADMDFSFSFGEDAPQTMTQTEQAVEAVSQVASETPATLWDFSLDIFQENAKAAETTENETVLSLTPTVSDVSVEQQVSGETIDFGLSALQDIAVVDTPSEVVVPLTIQNEMTVSEPVIDQVFVPEITAQTSTEESSVIPQEEGLNDILSATIAKLTLRADAIEKDTSGKATHISDIKAQIQLLEQQVAELEADIGVLNIEAEKITKNIEALEGMKLDPVKEHNARRVAKK